MLQYLYKSTIHLNSKYVRKQIKKKLEDFFIRNEK